MAIEFRLREIKFGRQVEIDVLYKGEKCKDYVADFIVGDVVVGRSAGPRIAECWGQIKAKKNLNGSDKAQLINYLSQRDDSGEPNATGKKVGLLMNFGGENPEFKRLVF